VRVAAALTVVILLGYGGFVAWNAWSGGGSDRSTQSEDTGYVGSTKRAIFFGALVLDQGVAVHHLDELAAFRYDADRHIEAVRAARAEVAALLPGTTGTRADILGSTVQAADELEVAMTQWRDAVYNLRFGSAPTARSAVESAIARLWSDLGRWEALES
jgi:hypothetical protein